MSDEPDLTEQLLDLMVYVPIGLALEAKDLLPKLAERGRGQVNLMRFAGKVASNQGTTTPRGIVDQLVATFETLVGGTTTTSPSSSPPVDEAPAEDDEASEEGAPSRDDGPDLPITGYDSLSAPQLLPYLEPLTDDQLADVLAYEEGHRSRATVINRIKQLQA